MPLLFAWNRSGLVNAPKAFSYRSAEFLRLIPCLACDMAKSVTLPT